MKNRFQFTGKNGEFRITHLKQQHEFNFPVANEDGIKSSVTQNFGGDCKLDQNHFLITTAAPEISGARWMETKAIRLRGHPHSASMSVF